MPISVSLSDDFFFREIASSEKIVLWMEPYMVKKICEKT